MNQGQDDKLQQAINQVAQNTTNIDSSTNNHDQIDSIVPQRNMTSDTKNSSNDEAVAAAMASVLPNSNPEPAIAPTPPVITPSPSAAAVNTSTSPNESIAVPEEMNQVKEQALRELVPLLANMNINPEQKFKIYRDMIESLHDNSVAMPALEAAKQIQDENIRAEALLYLVTLIDELSGK